MKYGHFSDQEINEIVLILERNNISFQVFDDLDLTEEPKIDVNFQHKRVQGNNF